MKLISYFIQGVRLAKEFENMVKSDGRFEIPAARHLGMVVFRLKGPNDLTEALLKKINTSGKLHCVPAALKVRFNKFLLIPIFSFKLIFF